MVDYIPVVGACLNSLISIYPQYVITLIYLHKCIYIETAIQLRKHALLGAGKQQYQTNLPHLQPLFAHSASGCWCAHE